MYCLDDRLIATMVDSDDENYTVPLVDQRYFGAGIKRKRVQFVPSSTVAATNTASLPAALPAVSASDKYFSVVFKKPQLEPPSTAPSTTATVESPEPVPVQNGSKSTVCDICHLPVSSENKAVPHEASLVHQVCLPHAHPPSAVDRTRKGFDILQAYGWDPDKRLGLGAAGEGILHPIKAKEKRDRIGLGMGVNDEETGSKARKKKREPPKEVPKLDAGKVKKLEAESKKRDEKLRNMFYGSSDLDRYLGGG